MNCPSRTDETLEHDGWNQNPSRLAADLTTRQDLNGIANSRAQRGHVLDTTELSEGTTIGNDQVADPPAFSVKHSEPETGLDKGGQATKQSVLDHPAGSHVSVQSLQSTPRGGFNWVRSVRHFMQRSVQALAKYGKFVGPGFMIAVAYIDPGNYSTDVAAGASTKFGLLFIVLMSNVFAIFLQSLCVKLGTVTGLNLAEHCRAHLPKWLNLTLYVFGESAIIATDIAEV